MASSPRGPLRCSTADQLRSTGSKIDVDIKRLIQGLLGVHSRYSLYTRAVTVFRHTLPEGFSHFVTSIAAPVASGWSGCRVGLTPTGKRRLSTAHGQTGLVIDRPDQALLTQRGHWQCDRHPADRAINLCRALRCRGDCAFRDADGIQQSENNNEGNPRPFFWWPRSAPTRDP